METEPVSKLDEEKEINLLDVTITLMKWKRLILGGTLALAAITAIIVLVVSPIYRGKSTLMPPQDNSASAAAQLAGQLGSAASMILGTPTTSTSGELYVGLLQNPAVLDPIIERFHLVQLYGVDTREDARRMLVEDGILQAEVDSKSSIISVSIDDPSPARAAEMANAFVDELRKTLETVAVTDEAKKRLFFERELRKAHEALSASEDALRGFQEGSGVLKIDDQALAILQGIAALKAQIASREVQIRVMRTYATERNPDIMKAIEEVKGLKGELQKLEVKQEQYTPDALMPMGQIPELGTEYIRKMRDFRFNEALYELLEKQYEAARIEEARESAIVQVIQKATPPEKRTKPKRGLIVAIVSFLGFFMVAGLAILKEALSRRCEDPENALRLKRLKEYFMNI